MRSRFFFAAVALPLAAAGLAYGCSDEPPLESVCRWVSDPESCIREFHEDTTDDNGVSKCQTGGVATLPDAMNLTGTSNGAFLSRAALDVCFIATGGSVVFDPPLVLDAQIDLTKPPVAQKMVIKNADGTECGSASYTGPHTFSITVNPPPDAGLPAPPVDAEPPPPCVPPADDPGECFELEMPSGTYSSIVTTERDVFDTTCPNGEAHHFLLLEADNGNGSSACPNLAAYVPRGFFIVNSGGVDLAGSVSFAIVYPPLDATYPDSKADPSTAKITVPGDDKTSAPADTVVYFNCLIPGAPQVCANTMKDGAETDIDCGGKETAPGCPARCGDGQACTVDCDCDAALTCGVVMGVKKCVGDDAGAPPRDCSSFVICADGIIDPGETDVDCGGLVCPKCGEGNKCQIDGDCTTGFCEPKTKLCAPASCSDGIQNQGETDKDCGAVCAADMKLCKLGQKCATDADCATTAATPLFCQTGVCATFDCNNKAKDGSETDVDCGGGCATKCANTKACKVNGDCVNNACVNMICVFPQCDDMAFDGKETDVDCGGGAASGCGGCDTGKKCNSDSDCLAPNLCGSTTSTCPGVASNKVCYDPAACGVICGGVCPLCDDGVACNNNSECLHGVCDTNSFCQTSSCSDGLKGCDESDVDCGGSCATKCTANKKCNVNADCAMNVCISGVCQL